MAARACTLAPYTHMHECITVCVHAHRGTHARNGASTSLGQHGNVGSVWVSASSGIMIPEILVSIAVTRNFNLSVVTRKGMSSIDSQGGGSKLLYVLLKGLESLSSRLKQQDLLGGSYVVTLLSRKT